MTKNRQRAEQKYFTDPTSAQQLTELAKDVRQGFNERSATIPRKNLELLKAIDELRNIRGTKI